MIDDVIDLLTDDSAASNPGGVHPRRRDWIRHRPIWWLFVSLPMWGCLIAGFLIPMPELWAVSFILAPFNWFYWSRVKTHFTLGDANPGVIVSCAPPLMAVETDLSRGDGEYPAVKVVRVSLKDINETKLTPGQRVPTVSLYGPPRTDQVPYWSDFDPLPVQYADSRPQTADAVMMTFAKEDWTELKKALKQVPRPFKPGLFPIGWDGKYLAK